MAARVASSEVDIEALAVTRLAASRSFVCSAAYSAAVRCLRFIHPTKLTMQMRM